MRWPSAKFRKNKGGIKIHTQIDLRGNLPVFIHLTQASVHDVNAMDEMYIEMGAIYLMDKGYVDFFRLFNNIHKNGAFFVTRAKDNMQYKVVSSREVDCQTGVVCDQIIRLTEEISVKNIQMNFAWLSMKTLLRETCTVSSRTILVMRHSPLPSFTGKGGM